MTAPRGPVVGIDIGGTKILGVRLPEDPGDDGAGGSDRTGAGRVDQVKVPTPPDGAGVMSALERVIQELTAHDPGSPAAIGVGIPGLVDREGVLRFSPHLPGLVGLPVAGALDPIWPGVALWVGNDATAAGWAEHLRGAAAGMADVVMVTIGTGIGGGIVRDGRLSEGAHRFAGEFGHMVVDPHGPACPCGKRGCWERFASGNGLGLLGREAALAGQAPSVRALAGGDPELVRGEHVTVAAAGGAPDAVAIMGRFGWWLALGLANLANAFDPDMIVLGGGLIDVGEVLLGPTRRAFAELVEAHGVRGGVPIVAAALGPQAGAIGAGLLALGGAADRGKGGTVLR
ncbi:MAG: ROK family protein [Acidimicrobiales bacterium]